MNAPERCPFCGSATIVAAVFTEQDGGNTTLSFPGVKPFPWWKYGSETRAVAYDYSPWVCLQCGMLWTKFNLAEARKLIAEHGPAELKALLPDKDGSPP